MRIYLSGLFIFTIRLKQKGLKISYLHHNILLFGIQRGYTQYEKGSEGLFWWLAGLELETEGRSSANPPHHHECECI